MKEKISLPDHLHGRCWHHVSHDAASRPFWHRHDELEVNLVLRGRASYLVQERKYDLQRGDVLWLFPEQEHVLLDQSPDFSMWILVWKPQAVQQGSRERSSSALLQGNPTGDFCRRLAEPSVLRLHALFEEQQAAQNTPDLFNAGLVYALHLTWAITHASVGISSARDVHPAVEKAARLLQTESASLSLEALGHRVGMSSSRLSRLFKEQTGVSLAQFRNRQRLERFFQLYGSGRRRSLQQAALEAGFGSYPQFHRVFKAALNQSPATFFRGDQTNDSTG